MKNKLQTLLIAIAIFFSQQVFAGFGTASLSIRTEKQDWLYVTFDGTQYNNQTNVFKLQNLVAGNHYLEVIRKDFEPNYHGPATYTVFSGWVTLAAGFETRGLVTKTNQLKLEQVATYSPYSNGYYTNGNCNNGFSNGYNNGYYNGYYNGSNAGCNYPYYNSCVAMNAYDFAALKQTITAQWFESTKISTAKMGLGANYFTADQIRDILFLFSFESSKLEVAKYAYDRCIDKQNYFKVYDAFSFSSSVDELSNYVMHH